MGAILDAALEYAEAGYAVIPVKRSDKAPYTPNGLTAATTNQAAIRQWWEWWPDANVAIVCGNVSGGIVVVDVDVKGKNGFGSISYWEAQHGDFPETAVVHTGSGGKHYYFHVDNPEAFKNRVETLPGVDIRGDGAYVVAPPSVHENGKMYTWRHGVSCTERDEVAEANESVLELLNRNPKDSAAQKQQDAANRQRTDMHHVQEGQRNDTLFRFASKMVGSGISRDAALEAARTEIATWENPLPDFEIVKTVNSAYDSYTPNEQTIYGKAPVQEYDENGNYIPKLPPSLPIESIITPPPLKPPIIKGFLREGEAMLISGSPKAGKSFLICQLALAVASGTKWVGQDCKQKKVLYIDAELPIEVALNRMHNIWRKLDNVIPVFPETLDIKSTKNKSVTLSDVADDIEHDPGRYDLVIIDPLYMFINSDQNDNAQMKKEMEQIQRIYATGAAVIVNHHMTKGMQNGKMSIDRASGAGVISRFFDSILTLNLLQPEPTDEGRPERIEADTRSFKQPDPIDLFFDGFHVKDTTGDLQFRQLLDPKKENNDRKVDNIVKRVNHCYLKMKADGILTDGKFTVDDFINTYGECYGLKPSRTTAREHLKKAGYIKQDGEKTTMRSGKPLKVNVAFYMPDGTVEPEETGS